MALNKEPTILVLTRDKEASYNTPELIGGNVFMIPFRGEASVPQPGDVDTDADEYTGKKFISRMQTMNRTLEFQFETNLTANIFAWAAGLLLGQCTTTTPAGATLSRLQAIEFADAINLPSTTLWQASPDYGNKEYPGMCVSALSLKAPKSKFATLGVTTTGSGKENAGSDLSAITQISGESYFKSSQVDVLLGGTVSEADGLISIATGTSIKGKMADFGCELKNGAERNFGYRGSAAQDESIAYPDSVRKADLKTLDTLAIPITLEPNDATELDYIRDEDEVPMEVRIIGPEIETGFRYFIKIFFPITRALKGSKGHDKSIATADITFNPKKDTSVNDFPFCQIQVQNKQSGYLL